MAIGEGHDGDADGRREMQHTLAAPQGLGLGFPTAGRSRPIYQAMGLFFGSHGKVAVGHALPPWKTRDGPGERSAPRQNILDRRVSSGQWNIISTELTIMLVSVYLSYGCLIVAVAL